MSIDVKLPALGEDAAAMRHFVSPVARRLAAAYAIDTDQLHGTGGGGRVTKRDVEAAIARHETADRRPPTADDRPQLALSVVEGTADDAAIALEASDSGQQSAVCSQDVELVPLSAMRRSIAQHMTRSKQLAPHATTVIEADLSRVVAHRNAQRASYEQQGVRLTFTPYFVYAAALALRKVPALNASFSEHGILLHRQVHVGVAVAVPDGLVVPVIRNADECSLRGLARSVNDLAERGRARQLRPDETQGGTFTITNHGGAGSLLATPIIHQPQAAILGIGAIQKRVVVLSDEHGDTLAIRPMCYLSLSFDHRLVDGTTADAFLMAVKTTLEQFNLERI